MKKLTGVKLLTRRFQFLLVKIFIGNSLSPSFPLLPVFSLYISQPHPYDLLQSIYDLYAVNPLEFSHFIVLISQYITSWDPIDKLERSVSSKESSNSLTEHSILKFTNNSLHFISRIKLEYSSVFCYKRIILLRHSDMLFRNLWILKLYNFLSALQKGVFFFFNTNQYNLREKKFSNNRSSALPWLKFKSWWLFQRKLRC